MKCPNSNNSENKKTIILIPYPAQGHVTPMVNLATSLLNLNRGLNPLILTPRHIHRRLIAAASETPQNGVAFAAIHDEPMIRGDFFSVEEAMENDMPAHLERLVVHELGVDSVVCVVVDLLASWAIDVARRCGVPAAGFWPAMLATYRLIAAMPEMVRSGLISDSGSPQHQGAIQFLPNQLPLSTEELPWLIGSPAARRSRFKFWTKALSRSRTLPFILINSFPDESLAESDDLTEETRLGPALLALGSATTTGRHLTPTLWDQDTTCLQWLDDKEPNSVIYISFGSWVSPIGESKVRSLAMALDSLGHFFIWVVADSWRSGLPDGFEERVKGKGKIVSWAPQMEVLSHNSVGFYLTHCGWNSTVEAIRCQKRMLCYPIAGDQFLNCNYIVKVWKIGVKICGLGKREVEEGLKKVVGDCEMGNRLRKVRDKVVGDEAGFRARSSLEKFADFLGKQTDLD